MLSRSRSLSMGFQALIAVLALSILTPSAQAQAPIIDFTGGENQSVASDITYGYDFTISSGMTVTGLGVWESISRPLGAAHEVGIWNSAGTLLASITIDGSDTLVASTSAIGHWRKDDIAPLALAAGQYFAGVHYFMNDDDVLVFASPNSIAGVTYNDHRYEFGGALTFPGQTWFNTLVGPAIFAEANEVPEPGSIALLMGTAVVGLQVIRRRVRR